MLDEQDATNRDAKGLPFTVISIFLGVLKPPNAVKNIRFELSLSLIPRKLSD